MSLTEEDAAFLRNYQLGSTYRGRTSLKRPRPLYAPNSRVLGHLAQQPGQPSADAQLVDSAAGTIGALAGGALGGSALGFVSAGNPAAIAAGASLGTGVGKFLGGEMSKKFRSWFGMGDYTLKSNSLINTGGATESDVQIVPQGNREVRIIYREYLGDVYTHPTVAGQFNLQAFPVNPGLVSTFPWLAPIAQQYEQWTPNGIVFEFKSTSSEYTATQALGSVIMATEYDVLDSNYASKQEMLNSCYSNEAKPSQRIVHGIECDPRDNPQSIFYVRNADVPATGDIRDYDLARFQVATQGGGTANLNLGSLYVHYDITFRKEQLFGGVALKGALFYFGQLNGPVTNSLPLGSSTPTTVDANFVPTIALNTVTFPNYTVGAVWFMQYYLVGTAAAISVAGAATLTGCAYATAQPDLQFNSSPGTGTSSTRVLVTMLIKQTAATATYQFPTSWTLPTSATAGHLYIAQQCADVAV